MTPPAAIDPAFASRLERLDVSLFKGIPSQTKTGDRASLLALQEGVATVFGAFEYLEIGSHLGGSLQAAVRDPRVERIVSIDLRPEATPDERGKRIPYAGNSTQRMLDNLAALPGADLDKVLTIDADTRALDPAALGARPRLCFIDGEHTNESCLADARYCRLAAAPDAVIAFHDSGLIFSAIATFLDELRRDGVDVIAYPLPDSVFVVELGDAPVHATAAIPRLLADHGDSLHPVAALLARRTGGIGPARRALMRAWLSEPAAGRRLWRRRMAKRRKVMRRRALRRVRRAPQPAPLLVRILFLLAHAGLFRNFESTLRGLAEQGHDVHVAFDSERYPSDAFAALLAAHPNVTTGPRPSRPPTAGRRSGAACAPPATTCATSTTATPARRSCAPARAARSPRGRAGRSGRP